MNYKLKKELFKFFIWFRDNGQKYLGISAEDMIDIYAEETNGKLNK